jgi:hypothetical protein
MRLDKQYFKKQSFASASDHQPVYHEMSEKERSEVFLVLMQAAFGFAGSNWPAMEKAVFNKRKRK